MANGLYFVMLHLNYLKEEKFNHELTDSQKWRYCQLYMLAKELNENGLFIRHGTELSSGDIAWDLHITIEQLQADLDAMKKIGLITENGRGPCLARFEDEQRARLPAERKAAERERDRSHYSHELVTLRDAESESESELKKESESEREVESSVKGNKQPSTDDLSLTEEKKKICTAAGIPPKFAKTLTSSPLIRPDDLLAELTRNYSKRGTGKGKVQNPGYITGMNLVKSPPEKPGPEWYDTFKWAAHLPTALRQKLGLSFQGDQDSSDTLGLMATRSSRGEEVAKEVNRIFGKGTA